MIINAIRKDYNKDCMNSPNISILITVYNGERYLKTTIESILSQTFQNFEILIIDDNSTDQTHNIIKSFPDSRIRLIINDSRIGLPQSLNKGIKLARGKYIARLDSDDICFKNRLEIQVNYLNNHPECGLIAGKIKLINDDGLDIGIWDVDCNNISYKEILRVLPYQNCIAQSSVTARREIFNEFLYNPDVSYAEDYELWMRLAGNNIILEKMDEFVVFYRKHTTNLSYSYELNRDISDDFNYIRKKALSEMKFLSNPIFFLRMIHAIFVIAKGTYILKIKSKINQYI